MAFIVTSACVGCKDTECVQVCPVDCFYEGPNMLVIDPDECIDCGLCVPECPVDAIFSDVDLPDEEIPFIEINEKASAIWPNIVDTKSALAEASPYSVEEAIKIAQAELQD